MALSARLAARLMEPGAGAGAAASGFGALHPGDPGPGQEGQVGLQVLHDLTASPLQSMRIMNGN